MEKYSARARRHIVERGRSVALRRDYATPHLAYKPSYAVRRRVEASLDICSWHRSRCTVATAPEDGTRHPQLQPSQHCLLLEQVGLVLAPYRREGPRDATSCRGTARRYMVQRDRATSRRAERTARRYMVQRNRAMPCCAEGPRHATACRETRATSRRAEKLRDVTWCRGTERATCCRGTTDFTSCRGTARRYSVQRNRVMPCSAERQRDVTYRVLRSNRATPRGAERPCDAKSYRETARRHVVQRDRATLQHTEENRAN